NVRLLSVSRAKSKDQRSTPPSRIDATTRPPSGLILGYMYGRSGAAIGVSRPSRSTQTRLRGPGLDEPIPRTYASVPSEATTASPPPPAAPVVTTSEATGRDVPRVSRVTGLKAIARNVLAAA